MIFFLCSFTHTYTNTSFLNINKFILKVPCAYVWLWEVSNGRLMLQKYFIDVSTEGSGNKLSIQNQFIFSKRGTLSEMAQ